LQFRHATHQLHLVDSLTDKTWYSVASASVCSQHLTVFHESLWITMAGVVTVVLCLVVQEEMKRLKAAAAKELAEVHEMYQ
jgi:hypothetical protein